MAKDIFPLSFHAGVGGMMSPPASGSGLRRNGGNQSTSLTPSPSVSMFRTPCGLNALGEGSASPPLKS